MQDLHPVQKKLLKVLKANMDDPLTIRHLQELIGVSSPSVVHHHITQLEKKGLLRRNPSNPYDYQVLMGEPEKEIAFLNLYGLAQCGPHGSILDGNPVDRIRISSKLLGFSALDAFAVKAKGTSMLPKIKPGDLVIAKKSNAFNSGDFVICINDGEALIKEVQIITKDDKHIAYNLISANSKEYPSFLASKDFRVEGIVRGVLTYSL